jgi:hypothetical protein
VRGLGKITQGVIHEVDRYLHLDDAPPRAPSDYWKR